MSNVTVSFDSVVKGFKTFCALKEATFQINESEIFGFIGPNGCGKTTTARLMLGFYKPTQGVVRIFGANPATQFNRVGSQVGVMLEQPGMHDGLTAYEYLEYYGGIFRMPSADLHSRAREMLKLVGLADRANSFLKTFSKGMRQRISMARCLLNRPRLIILDEPFDGLDVESRRMILDLLPLVSKEQGTSVFVTSHNLAEVEEVSHRVAIVKKGAIVALDTMESLRNRVTNGRALVVNLAHDYPEERINELVPDTEYCRKTRNLVLSLNALNGSRDELLLRLLNSGISINSVERETASLEDVYFALTKETQE